MPTYEYTCTDCGHDLEVFQKFSDDPLTVCPDCNGHLRKVFSPVGVVFKGSGFYATDNRTSGASTAPGESMHDAASTTHTAESSTSGAESSSSTSESPSTGAQSSSASAAAPASAPAEAKVA